MPLKLDVIYRGPQAVHDVPLAVVGRGDDAELARAAAAGKDGFVGIRHVAAAGGAIDGDRVDRALAGRRRDDDVGGAWIGRAVGGRGEAKVPLPVAGHSNAKGSQGASLRALHRHDAAPTRTCTLPAPPNGPKVAVAGEIDTGHGTGRTPTPSAPLTL